MSIQSILGKKIKQGQGFLENGTRIPVTYINVAGNVVVAIKTKDKDSYNAISMGFGSKKKSTKPMLGVVKAAGLKKEPQFLREISYADSDTSSLPPLGTIINPTEVFKLGDIVDVIGISKGKGYAGVVKRHHFKGGPRTHGQSDRERAPGSIGQTTTPGRVYKGKRMAGRMGHERVTIENLRIVEIGQDFMVVKGLVPGPINNYLIIKKSGEDRKFVPLYREVSKVEKVSEVSKGENVKIEDKKEEVKDAKS